MFDEMEHAHEALLACDPSCPRDEWLRIAMSAKAAGLDFAAFDDWSSGGATYSQRSSLAVWRSIRGDGGVSARSLFAAARAHGWSPPKPTDRKSPVSRAVASPRPEQPAPDVRPHGNALARLWAATQPLAGTAGEAYLLARGCALPPADGDLRFAPDAWHGPSGTRGPALVTLITNAMTGEPQSLHRTWVRSDGTKAPVEPARMYLGGHPKSGGTARLWPSEATTTGLLIGEGIESVLSAAHAFAPAWAALDAGGLASFPVLAGIESLTIAGDHDPAGIRAAHACAQRWTEAGREVRIAMAPDAGADLNDFARAAA